MIFSLMAYECLGQLVINARIAHRQPGSEVWEWRAVPVSPVPTTRELDDQMVIVGIAEELFNAACRDNEPQVYHRIQED